VDGEVCGTTAELEEASAGTKVDQSGLSTVGLPTVRRRQRVEWHQL
jgi:hypothetical protein